MTFEVKPSITFVAVHPYILLTKFGRNRTKNVEVVADCQKKKEERRKKERKKSEERNKLGETPNLKKERNRKKEIS